MLLRITVENFALIDRLELNFEDGFTILTGETGAGKSILIDSINFVLGEKFSKEFIRTGSDRTFVEAVFTLEDSMKDLLEAQDIPFDDLVVFSRETFMQGRNLAKINGKTVLLNVLKEVGKELLDIHGQHNNQNLLDVSKHLSYLDSFIDLEKEPVYRRYLDEFHKLQGLKDRLSKLMGSRDREKLMDYLKFQIEDLEKGKLNLHEEKELMEKFSMLSHAEKISTGLTKAYELMDNENGVLESLTAAIQSLKSIAKHFEKADAPLDNLENAYYLLQEAYRDIAGFRDIVYYDQDELNTINERLFVYSTYKKKYGETIEEVLRHYEKIRQEYEDLKDADEIILKTRKEIDAQKKIIFMVGKELHDKRVSGGKALSKKINEELKFIGLEKAEFAVSVVETEEIHEYGTDDVSFLISTNIGEPKKALEKIVSGGELSRIMLAMKVAFMEKDKTPSVIFDEIDTGISGRIAEAVGEKMYSLSKRFQVFCVTHLPQIAAFSDHHLVVSKHEEKKRTFTRVEKLNLQGKTMELAKMIGGSKISDPQLKNAEDTIDKTEILKKKYFL